MKANGYFTQNQNFVKKGTYKATTLDEYKASVDFLITSVGKRRYEIIFNQPTQLKIGRSVTPIGSGIYEGRAYLVTEKALNELKENYTWGTDF